MSESYLLSKVITIPKASVTKGALISLSDYGLSSGLIHLYGLIVYCTLDDPPSNSAESYLSIHDGNISDVKLIFDCFTSVYTSGPSLDPNGTPTVIFDDFYIKFNNGISIKANWSASNTNPVYDVIITVFYK